MAARATARLAAMERVRRQRRLRDIRSGLEHVAGAADGADKVGLAGGVKLLAQVADVDLDGVGLDLEVVAPDLLEDRLLGEDLAGVAGHELQELVLPGRGLYGSPPRLPPQ